MVRPVGGTVGARSADGSMVTAQLPAGEEIKNSFSIRPGGQAAVVTDHALYGLRIAGDTITTVWRRAYDNGGGIRKPGQLSRGSGTTPTYFGPGKSSYVAIVDNGADPKVNVYNSDDGSTVCSMSAFGTFGGPATENSPVALKNSLILSSTWGSEYPSVTEDGPATPRTAPFTGGLTKVDVSPQGCRRAWETGSRDKVATLPKLSTSNGEIHFLGFANTPVNLGGEQNSGQVYYSAVDFETGQRRAFVPVALTPFDDPIQLTAVIGPDGTLWQGTTATMLKITH
ncbi:hypothetical protein [Gordonia rhizosphera]|uniref:Uncharacterized protein n=1 Tax=Gordonia rhizosphera NBRC 16068 TaxID=1108045 RepID=K6WNT8_9ACTN|nr:hypothetical protein [Gordonia rhizosphera]GAB88199.1 hypothetical protein GORHZ_009_00140 [Gordonia rhizosphera NBRC 16068]